MTPADKTSNMYGLEKEEYKHLLTSAITSAYRKVRKDAAIKINQGGIKEGFDVTMGAYDGAEICELIGIFMLSLLGTKSDSKNIGLYRDDGLSIFRNVSGPELEKIKKHIQKIFEEKMLDVIIECNTKIVNYLVVIFKLNDGTYKPYKKPNDETKYIHVDSDHPPSIINRSQSQ